MALSHTIGQLLVVGFSGTSLTPTLASALREGRRAGVIAFKRNLPDLDATRSLSRAVRDAAGATGDLEPLIALDEEGGRVRRLPAPSLALPPMRQLGQLGDVALTHRAALAVAAALRGHGFNLNFAPVLDVDSNPANPVIGDRALSSDPHRVAELGVAFADGLAEGGVLACGKHFPGHGDTDKDSHLDLPHIAHPRSRLDAVELVPFRAAARAGIDSLMTAHVVIDAIDPGVPATLSKPVMTDLCRRDVGFEGALFSDDLEMGALAQHGSIEQTSVTSVLAGCDVLLVCKDEALAERAFGALLREAEGSPTFLARCEEAARRVLELRQLAATRARRSDDVPAGALASVLDEIARRTGGLAEVGADPTNPRPRGVTS